MNVQAFENLELIPKLLKQVELLADRMAKYAPPVTTKKEVAKLLNKTQRTINNYMSEGLLREGYHYHKKNGKMVVFIEDAILEFREILSKGIANEKVTI